MTLQCFFLENRACLQGQKGIYVYFLDVPIHFAKRATFKKIADIIAKLLCLMRTITQKNIQIWIKQTCYQRPYCVFQENKSTDTYLNNKNKLTSSQTIFLRNKDHYLLINLVIYLQGKL